MCTQEQKTQEKEWWKYERNKNKNDTLLILTWLTIQLIAINMNGSDDARKDWPTAAEDAEGSSYTLW